MSSGDQQLFEPAKHADTYEDSLRLVPTLLFSAGRAGRGPRATYLYDNSHLGDVIMPDTALAVRAALAQNATTV